jgi:RNA polymerase sigma-70 factor (ECF subfamily)
LTDSDRQLLERAREYEPRALADIYDAYAEGIYRYLYRFLGNAAQAEDLTSEVFVKLLQVLNTRRGPRNQLQGWLYRVAHNLAVDWYRRQARQAQMPLREDLVSSGPSPATQVETIQVRQELRTAISQLTPDQQRVVLLRFGEGYKIAKVAHLMDKSEGAVKVLQHRAIKRLRKLLDRADQSALLAQLDQGKT